jgi:hypothetical protein
MALPEQLEAARQREQIAAWDRREAELRKGFPARSLSVPVDIRDRFGLFEKWCSDKSVRRLPAKPWVVAAFILDQTANGRDAQGCLALLAAIEAVHDVHSLSNPTATALVRSALESIIKSDPPRSWPEEDRASWATLPPDIRAIIARRENDRDRELRRKQNEISELKKRLLSGADESPQTNEKVFENESSEKI